METQVGKELSTDKAEKRKKTEDLIVNYMEREVSVKLTELNTLLVLQDARFRDEHQVDMTSSYSATTIEINRIIDEKLPSLTLTDQIKLSIQAKSRHIELKIANDYNLYIARREQWESYQSLSLRA